jgi:hypothetical protein
MRLNPWNIFFSFFYAIMLFTGIGWLVANQKIFYAVPTRDLVLITLAIYRLIRLFTYDIITKFIRDWFAGSAENTLAGTLSALVNCPWCTGLWFSFIVVFFYFATPYAWPVILILALAGAASFMQIVSNLIGWSAEYRKLESQKLSK